MKKQTRSILNELQSFLPAQSKEIVIGNRASHIIESAINLFELIDRNYSPEQAEELKKRMFSSIKNSDPKRFEKTIKKFKSDGSKNG